MFRCSIFIISWIDEFWTAIKYLNFWYGDQLYLLSTLRDKISKVITTWWKIGNRKDRIWPRFDPISPSLWDMCKKTFFVEFIGLSLTWCKGPILLIRAIYRFDIIILCSSFNLWRFSKISQNRIQFLNKHSWWIVLMPKYVEIQ